MEEQRAYRNEQVLKLLAPKPKKKRRRKAKKVEPASVKAEAVPETE